MNMAKDGTIDPELTKDNIIHVEGWIWNTDGLPHSDDIAGIGKSGWKSGMVIVKISDLEQLGFKKFGPGEWGQCQDCPGRTMEMPFNCSVANEIEHLVGQHSGLKNRMEIQVTKCHHKDRVIKDAVWKQKVIDDAKKQE